MANDGLPLVNLTMECLGVCLRSLKNSWTHPRVRYMPFSTKNQRFSHIVIIIIIIIIIITIIVISSVTVFAGVLHLFVHQPVPNHAPGADQLLKSIILFIH